MPVSKVDFFRAFLLAISSMIERPETTLSKFNSEFNAEISEMNPEEANEYALEQFEQLTVNHELLNLYHAANAFMNGHSGDGVLLDNDIPLVIAVTEKALALSGKSALSLSFIPQFIHVLEESVDAQVNTQFLIAFLKKNVAALQEYRIKKLEAAMRTNQVDENTNSILPFFTLHQQLLAIHFMLTEGMDVNNMDNTKVIALAHLLTGKKIPLDKDGRENIGNSGIKSAFGKMWQKQGSRHLSDLLFILRFFKPFEQSSESMKSIVKAIEKEIAKMKARLDKEKGEY